MSDLNIKWKNSALYPLDADALHQIHPMDNVVQTPFMAAYSQTELVIYAHSAFKLIVNNVHKVFQVGSSDLVFSIASRLDTGAIEAGKDYSVYVCDDGDGTACIKTSLASTYPAGYSAQTSRKIGGLHTLCVAAGTLAGHPLTGFLVKAILPASVWCLNHRSRGLQAGMVYDPADHEWKFIYMASGTGVNTGSVYGATISDTRNAMDFGDDMAAIGCRLLADDGFSSAAEGSNQETNIAGSADPVTTGGHTCHELLTLDVAPGGAGWAVGDWIIGASSGKVCKIAQILTTLTYIVTNRTGAFTLGEVLNNSELLTLDVAPAAPGWAAGNTITGGSSGQTCVIVEVLTNKTYLVKLRSGNFTVDEILSNGTTPADQGAAHPTVTTTIAADQGAANPTFAADYAHGGRLLSGIGCEDCCGVLNQWLRTPSARLEDGTAGIWVDLPGAKGSIYSFGTNGYGNTQLLAGGGWGDGARCGSRCRHAYYYRWYTGASLGARGCAESR